MQNSGNNPNQQMYYQQSQGGGVGMGYAGMGEQQQRQQQQQQQMMGMQGGMMTSPGDVPSQQMYPAPMQGVPQQRPYTARVQQGEMGPMRGQQQMYASTMQPYQQTEQSRGAPQQQYPQQQQMQQMQQQAPLLPTSSQQQMPIQRKADTIRGKTARRMTETKKEEVKTTRPLNPPPYSPEILNNLSKYSVWSLSVIGRELVQELIFRTQVLMNLLLKMTDRRYQQQAAGDPEQLLEYCLMILTRITEIRLRIDRVPRPQRISEDDFIEMMAIPADPVKSPEQVKKEEMFESQRQRLVKLSSSLKAFEWLCSVSDPRLLKKPEKL